MRQLSGVAAAAALVVSAAVLATAPGSPAAAAPAPGTDNPYAPNYQHPYRYGAVPTRARLAQMRTYTAAHARAATATASSDPLTFGGQVDGIGVTTGHERVYLVFWGTQWGTQGSDSNGDATFTGDGLGGAPRLQEMFKGLGTGGELWSGVMTQYCEGVASGSTSCPASSAHVGYPAGGALAGVWADPSAPAPAQATGNQIGSEAVKAAGHFGNTTAASNRNVQYVILSPTGTHPDGFNTTTGQFCAWHDYTGDTSLSGGAPGSPYGPLAFTNAPYVTDMGSSCGSNFVNPGPGGVDDGVTIVEGHEYAETVTDQFPAGGWTDLTGNENGDKCAWISSGQGAAQNITLSTGSYPVQSTWANDFNGGQGGCEVTHPTVS